MNAHREMLLSVIQKYAEANAVLFYAKDRGTGGDVESAQKEFNAADAELRAALSVALPDTGKKRKVVPHDPRKEWSEGALQRAAHCLLVMEDEDLCMWTLVLTHKLSPEMTRRYYD